MKTSANTRSGRISEALRTAASPLPTATTSMPWSFSARPTIFWILLLSSATRILATERPPGRNTRILCDTVVRPHFVRPAGRLPQPRHPASHLEVTQDYWSILPSGRQRQPVVDVSEVNTGLSSRTRGRLPHGQ